DENQSTVGRAVDEASGGKRKQKQSKKDVSGRDLVVLGSGNLGLIYLLDEPRRLTLEEIDARHPRLVPALREHPHVGWLLIRSERGALVLGACGTRNIATGEVDGEDPLQAFPPNAARHLARSDGFAHAADIFVGSFYDAVLEEGCAFEELICFHGGLGGPQTRPFLLYPATLPAPAEPVVGAAAVNEILRGWRSGLQGGPPPSAEPEPELAAAGS
ncbi:MAG TPA: hypothetical protein VFK71_08150, partial [Gaiellaceae bacterium]|nr:hypothetical protein [Gaiellaceae bacterium]